jgi:phage tail-like protein
MTRVDPYKKFKFRITWEGRPVAGFSKVGIPRWRFLRRSPYRAVTFEHGLTHDVEFEHWADKVGRGDDARMDVVLEERDESGRLARAYKLARCWVSEYQALPDLDAGAHAVEIQHLKLENEGFERDRGGRDDT